jgi:HK97 family phage major capsid protein
MVNAETRAQTTTDSAGGYSIPEQMMSEITRSMLAFGPMYDPGVTRELVTSGGNPMPWPTVNDTASTAGAHTEGATLTDDGGKDVVFGTKSLGAFAFDTEWLRISKELMDDSFLAVEALIGNLLGERLARIANLNLTTGSGSGAPNGIVTASGLGTTAAGTAAITADEIIDLEHSVDPAYRDAPGVAFMMNDSTLKAVRKLKDGDGNYLWQMGNVQAGIPANLLGRRIVVNQQMASLATGQKVMLFGDMQKYFVRKVGQPLIGSISDKDFWPGVGVAGYIRFDGELSDTAAVKHLITA